MDFKFNFSSLDEFLKRFYSDQKCINFLEKIICSVVANTNTADYKTCKTGYDCDDRWWKLYRVLQNHYQLFSFITSKNNM